MLPTRPSVIARCCAWLVCAVAPLAVACGDDARAKAHAADVASFDQVWTTVRDRHFDPTFGGLDWETVRTELRPKVLAAKNRDEARAVMRDMIGRLKLSHFAIIDTGVEDESDGTFGMVGLDVRPIDGEMIVTDIEADGPAAAAGVKLGWRIDAIGSKAVSELLAEVRATRRGSSVLPAEEAGVTMFELTGSTRTPIEVTFEDGAGQRVVKELVPADATGQISVLGNLVGLVVFDARRIGAARDVGYVRVGAFLEPARVMPRYRAAIADMKDTRGLVIDLRGNTGGLGPMAGGMLGELVRREVVLGTSHSRDEQSRIVANPQPYAYDGPVVVLVDELSMSTSEIFAAAVQELGRGRVIGGRTPGLALPSSIEKLPNGDIFQFAVAKFVTGRGRVLEGTGVEPDDVVRLERSHLLSGRDTPLEAAVAWIDRQSTETEESSP